jgi:Outer membrane protein beta-barrel domain
LTNVKCSTELNDFSVLNRLDYRTSEMIKYFLDANKCNGDLNSKLISLDKKTTINYKAVVGFNSSSLNFDFEYGSLAGNTDMGKNSNVSIGFEAEIVLPFNNNSWCVYTQPTFNSYEVKILKYDPTFTYPYTNVSATYKYIQVPLGGRKYFYLTKNSKLYLDAALNLKFANSSSKLIADRIQDYDMSGSFMNYEFGIGYQYKKISLEYRFYTTTNINSNPNSPHLFNYNNTCITLKYKLF